MLSSYLVLSFLLLLANKKTLSDFVEVFLLIPKVVYSTLSLSHFFLLSQSLQRFHLFFLPNFQRCMMKVTNSTQLNKFSIDLFKDWLRKLQKRDQIKHEQDRLHVFSSLDSFLLFAFIVKSSKPLIQAAISSEQLSTGTYLYHLCIGSVDSVKPFMYSEMR